jgi:4'-phosphopantetheinyl transferase EntD
VIAEILPAEVAAVDVVGEPAVDEQAGAALLPEEAAALGRAAEIRRAEFAAARTCARRALSRLGLPPAPILTGLNREPLWPAGVVGSITHCRGYRAAAVAFRSRLAAVGIDAEPHDALPDGVLERVSVDSERAWLDGRSGDGVCWDRVLFSAKESVFKAWFPLTRRWLGFEDAALTVDADAGTFRARLLVPGPVVDGRALDGFDGRYLVRDGFVLTAVTVAAWQPAGASGALIQSADDRA